MTLPVSLDFRPESVYVRPILTVIEDYICADPKFKWPIPCDEADCDHDITDDPGAARFRPDHVVCEFCWLTWGHQVHDPTTYWHLIEPLNLPWPYH